VQTVSDVPVSQRTQVVLSTRTTLNKLAKNCGMFIIWNFGATVGVLTNQTRRRHHFSQEGFFFQLGFFLGSPTIKPKTRTMTKRKYTEINGLKTGQLDSSLIADFQSLESRMAVVLQQIVNQLEINTQRINNLSQQMEKFSRQLGNMEVKVQVELTKKNWTSCSYISWRHYSKKMRWKQVNGQVVQKTGWDDLPAVVQQICEELFQLLSSHQPAYHVYQDCVELLLQDYEQTLEDMEDGEYHAEFELNLSCSTCFLSVEIGEQATSSVWVRRIDGWQ
jgi:hypothetical protein